MSSKNHVIQYLISDVQSKVDSTTSGFEINETDHSITELYLHANRVVLGMNAFIYDITGITCSLKPFSSELGIAKNVTIVDALIVYHCQYSNQTYILSILNALYIPTMQHNLIPPFLMRAGGVVVNCIPKIHFKDPMSRYHCI